MDFKVTPRLVIIVRTAIYAVIVICSFIMFAPISISMSKHNSNCLLYAEVGSTYGAKSICDYTIAIAVLFCLLCPLAVIILTLLTFLGFLKETLMEFTELPFLILVIADGVALFLVLISACTISVGLKTLCDSIIQGRDYSCADAVVRPIYGSSNHDYFHKNLATAEGGAWTAFVMWLAQFVLGMVVLWRNGRFPCLPGSNPANGAAQPSGPARY